MAEWLRRQTRNLLGSARAGSNPADCEMFLVSLNTSMDDRHVYSLYSSVV